MWFLKNVVVEDDADPKHNLLQTPFEPVEMTTSNNETKVKDRKIAIRIELDKHPDPPKEWCKEKPKEVRIRVRYDAGDEAARNYYTRPENALKEDPYVFNEMVPFKGEVAEVTWDGRDTGDAKRLIVRGAETKYYFEFIALACGHPLPLGGMRGDLPPMTVKPPHASLFGSVYPAGYISVIFHGGPVPVGCTQGALDGFGIGDADLGLNKRAVQLTELGPEGRGYDASADKNQAPGKVLGQWQASSIFVWLGHSVGNALLNYSGPGTMQDTPADITKFSAVLTPLVAEAKKDPWLASLKKHVYDFPQQMRETQLVVIGACWSAAPLPVVHGNLKGKSMLDVCVDRGADVAIGWIDSAAPGHAKKFLKVLFQHQGADDPATGKPESLERSFNDTLTEVGVPEDSSEIKIKKANGIDPSTISLRDLPRYGNHSK
ncbi:MAG: hypothetical protein HYY93_14230 [Planctomycetes bacterium]|nr:hypothetical protein [Planctomycetota bacterium]